MSNAADTLLPPRNLFGAPEGKDLFAGIADAEAGEGRQALEQIAAKIAETRRPGASSDIPAGATYLAQFAVHDLDFRGREDAGGGALLDLGVIYGDGPRHDAFCYQVPTAVGEPRHLLRIGRTRPTYTSPAWGAARDLPRTTCPHLDSRGSETKTEVLIPNSFSDSNLVLGQVQVLWALTHNAIATALAETRRPKEAFAVAQRLTRSIYRDVLIHDVLGNWLMPGLRARYASTNPSRIATDRPILPPREFMAGVARLGHGLVREIYALNDQMPLTGMRELVRHTGTGRPHAMPLTEEWLIDFSRFFPIGAAAPQKARALGPHVARPIAHGAGLGADGAEGHRVRTDALTSADSLVLRDLVACSRGGLRSVRSLVERAGEVLREGCFAQDENRWRQALREWLTEARLDPSQIDRLAADPPLTLFLMLEAEADTGGKSLGALGSIIMGETFAAALPPAAVAEELDPLRATLFRAGVPATMAELIRFLQAHYNFADGARLHPAEGERPTVPPRIPTHPLEANMLDVQTAARKPISRIEVADYIEMGRVIAQWSVDKDSWPANVAEFIAQLEGIAEVPDRIKHIHFVQGELDTLIIRLPVREMLEESIERMSDPEGDGRYPLPAFYQDHYRPGFGPVVSPLELLLARVGDYTIAQCK